MSRRHDLLTAVANSRDVAASRGITVVASSRDVAASCGCIRVGVVRLMALCWQLLFSVIARTWALIVGLEFGRMSCRHDRWWHCANDCCVQRLLRIWALLEGLEFDRQSCRHDAWWHCASSCCVQSLHELGL